MAEVRVLRLVRIAIVDRAHSAVKFHLVAPARPFFVVTTMTPFAAAVP